MEDELLFLGGATSISVSWAWHASPNSLSLCVPVPIDEQIHGTCVAVDNWGARRTKSTDRLRRLKSEMNTKRPA
jgi:hypothetical protein